MRTNFEAVELIKTFESLRLRSYRCPAGVMTIGYGSTKGVSVGMVISPREALDRLSDDILEFETQVQAALITAGLVLVAKKDASAFAKASPSQMILNENQFSACVSLAYNIGIEAFRKSTLVKYLAQGKLSLAADQFLVWNKSKGKVLAGLTKRRIAERSLFLKRVQ
jgi:lysozyme